ncbi:MAG: DNRLRE domain-containing protein [Candidatus Eiseniibacteriota bacterium]
MALHAGTARAVTFTTIIQPGAAGEDAHLREDNPTENRGDDSDLRIRAETDNKTRNAVIRFPLSGLSGRTVLRAWLELRQSGSNSTVPIDARVYPLTESWDEAEVTWSRRSVELVIPILWTTPGGTHIPFWLDRGLVSTATNNSTVQWQVGPVVQAWNTGALPNYGLLLDPDRTEPGREVTLRASEYGTATQRPRLVIHSTDEPPAIREATAEIQPRTVRQDARNVALTIWLDVDGQGATPSGAATGFDAIIVSHGGGLAISAVDRLVVGGASIPTSLVSWSDDGTDVTFRVPRIRTVGQVQLDVRVNVAASASSTGLELPVTVDDTSTPGVGYQQTWPGNADRIPGNGDDWILQVTNSPPTSIDLTPDVAQMTNLTCLPMTLVGGDALGNVFALQPDSVQVIPKSAGTVDASLQFCAAAVGTVKLVARYGALRDTSTVTVVSERLTQIHSLKLRDERGLATNTLAPGDTMFLDIELSDGDGLQDVNGLEIDLEHPSAEGSANKPAFGASFSWARGTSPAWKLLAPTGTSWSVLPALSVFDESDTTTGIATARLAFVVGRIARASNTGEWSAVARATSVTPLRTTQAELNGLDAATRLVLRALDPLGAFSPGHPGAIRLPLATPPDARLRLELESNSAFTLEGQAGDLVGLANPADTLHLLGPAPRLHWAFRADGVGGGDMDTSWTALLPGPPQDSEEAVPAELHLWLDHPPAIPEQSYTGALALRLAGMGPTMKSGTSNVALRATVVTSGLAAQVALAEVTPHAVTAGTTGQALSVFVLPLVQASDTGVDRVRATLPPGWGTPVVTGVSVAGIPVSFEDRSGPGSAEAVLAARVMTNKLIRLFVVADAPIATDATGAPFVVLYDDASTPVPPQTGTEGDANGQPDGNNWTVSVLPGPLASLDVAPTAAVMFPDSSLTFSASGRDAHGNAVSAVVTWRVEGGIGSIGTSTGAFTATTPGDGRVIAQSGTFADTALVTVRPARAIAVRSVTGPSTVYQGQTRVDLTVRIENLAPNAVELDTLDLRFSRAIPGDADDEFAVVMSPALPVVLPPGVTTALAFSIDVLTDALLAPLAVQGIASGTELATGIRLRDSNADTTLALNVVAGGIELTAQQTPGSLRPGSKETLLLTLRSINQYPEIRTLTSLVLANRTVGPGNREALDAELGELVLHRDDGNGVFDPGQDKEILRTSAIDGAVTFAPLEEKLGELATDRLFVAIDAPRSMRDGDLLDLEVTGAFDVTFESPVTFRNAWPVGAPGGLTVDGMTAVQITAFPVGPAALHPGTTDQLALDVLLPPNGYVTDMLTRVAVVNQGTAIDGRDIAGLEAWADDGDGVFSPAADTALGPLPFTGGDRWQLTGLGVAVPLAGKRVFVTVDAAPNATENATVKLALLASPDLGVGMASGNSGPLDVPVANPGQLTISNLDRVSLVAIPVSGGPAAPGDRGLTLLQLALTNNYSAARTLETIVLDRNAIGPGTGAELDGEYRLLTLRADGDGDGVLGDPSVDPVLATGFFQNGAATFNGLDVTLLPLASRQLFVTAEVSLTGARDGDVLGATLAGPNSVVFAEPTITTALWPLDSGARWTLDGFVAGQVTNRGAPAATVGPDAGPILALDLVVPANGYAPDLLRGVRVVNLGTATSGDFASIDLWRDGGDGAFGGDDVALGPLTFGGGSWTSALLSESVSSPGVRLFVSVVVGSAPAESATVRFAVPVDGIQYESGNDGPRDLPVANAEALLLSSAPLLATVSVPRASTVGQTIRVVMAVRNASAETIRSILPSLAPTDDALVTQLSGPVPATFDLAPAAIDTFEWQFRAESVGETRFTGVAAGTGDPSGLPRAAPGVSSNLHRIYLAAEVLELTPVQTMPPRVNRGQQNVVPFSLTLFQPGGLEASDVRIDRLRIRLEGETGAPIVPADLLDRVTVSEGTNVYGVKTGLETSGSEIDLPLATPAVVTGAQPTTLSLRIDLASDTVVPTFRVVIDDSTRIEAQDVTSGAPVSIRLAVGTYPVRSGVANVVAEATQLEVTALAQDTVRVGRGNTGVPLVRFRLENVGVSGISSAVRVTSLALALTDSTGDRPEPGRSLAELRIESGGLAIARRVLTASDPESLTIAFGPPLELGANAPVDLVLVGDIASGAPLGPFGARFLDSTHVDARDATTHVPVLVTFAPDSIRGGRVTVEARAETVVVRSTRALPAVVPIGERNVLAFRTVVRHPGVVGTARVRADSLVFECVDDLRRPLVPSALLDRAEVWWNGASVAEITSLPSSGNRVGIGLPGMLVEAGDTDTLEVRIDVDASAPSGFLELIVPAGLFVVRDANLGSPVTLVGESEADLPVRSGLGRLVPPARELAVGMTSRMPAVLVADGQAVSVARLALHNTDPQGAGPIPLDHLTVRARDRNAAALPVGTVASRVEAWRNGSLWAWSAALTPDSLTAHLAGDDSLSIAPGETVALEILLVTRTGATAPHVSVGFDRTDIGVIQPASALLAIDVRPEPGTAFPFWTESGGFSEANLAASYSNFPNPFAAGREATTFVYFLPGSGRVSLRILTLRGEPVATLLDGVSRAPGLQQSDVWDGRNGRADVVRNGVYLAELEVRFDDGRADLLRRKVAVVR